MLEDTFSSIAEVALDVVERMEDCSDFISLHRSTRICWEVSSMCELSSELPRRGCFFFFFFLSLVWSWEDVLAVGLEST